MSVFVLCYVMSILQCNVFSLDPLKNERTHLEGSFYTFQFIFNVSVAIFMVLPFRTQQVWQEGNPAWVSVVCRPNNNARLATQNDPEGRETKQIGQMFSLGLG